ncbi:MAG TPA: non-heme iron oxygenase ferredoxin subunit [Acidimicrobiales bacterium]|nr:non-heme iron oxygenase ferredoxin subunit [Acidimicrobiales bacterium]
MAEFRRVGSIDEVVEGALARFTVNGARVAVANVGGAFYAVDDRCTHKRCSLSKGDLEGTSVICPCHGGQYDLASGVVMAGPPPEPISVYPVRVVDGDLEIEV